tara:strand:- start:236 stop:658 length:423 start_codon:yes stop_codon:yes gene_type:complete
MKYFVIVMAILLAGCTKVVEVEKIKEVQIGTFTGTYPTADIRIMWQSCMQGHAQVRKLHPNEAGQVCDCVSDRTRIDFQMDNIKEIYSLGAKGQKGPDNKTRVDMVQYWTKANMECEMELRQGTLYNPRQSHYVDPKDML